MNAKLTKKNDANYKNGYVHCDNCQWHKELGNGFNQYHIDACPKCNNEISTRVQHTVTIGRPGNYTIKEGYFVYFVIENGIHVQFSGITYSERQCARLPE